ncbi:MAG: ABC transporter permease, partial [Prevotellaceae bacterium]|nr:ABC transporter permease [Prevotellaceae bacterium]
MNLPIFISLRYLFAKKSHNVVNLVSYISLTGVTLGAAALIVVMSVFNGFENLTASLYGTFDPPLKVSAVEGKTFLVDSLKISKIARLPGISSVAVTLEENVLIKYADRQALATMKGVDTVYEQITPLCEMMYNGEFVLHHKNRPTAVPGYDVAAKLGLFSLQFEEPMLFYVPKRGAKVALNNPAEALYVLPIYPSGIFAVEQSFDSKYIFVPLEFAEQLLDCRNRASALEIVIDSSFMVEELKAKVQEIMGKEMTVKTRYEQNPILYRMMKSEKVTIYFIVLFVVIILSVNVLSSLLLLIIEKKK